MKKFVIFALAFASNFAPSAFADIPATHGMVLFGKSKTYASHLPMFHNPHNYQVLLELQLADVPGSKAVETYESLKNQSFIRFTLAPKPFDLTKVISGEMKQFTGYLYKGHFEQGGKSLGLVQVLVKEVVYSNTLSAHQMPPADSEFRSNSFLIFGSDSEFYALHVVSGQPSYDAILSIDHPGKFIHQNCGRADCPEPIKVPIDPATLPVIASEWFDTDNPPTFKQIGDYVNSFRLSAKVIETIYADDADLQ